jgi:uncharacterized protein YigE (DUF2233 family)
MDAAGDNIPQIQPFAVVKLWILPPALLVALMNALMSYIAYTMKMPATLLLVTLLFYLPSPAPAQVLKSNDSLLVYTLHPKKQTLKLYWRDENKNQFRNFVQLKYWLARRGEKLVFAMNGGMYKADRSPVGLYIDSGKTITPLNKRSASGNFHLKPNGVFYLTKNKTAVVCATEKFRSSANILYATQSGPMLVVDGKIHPAFTKGSSNINFRNGVGILANGQVMFIMSKKPINFYDFAYLFLKAGCNNALYLDGFVSQTYLPSQQWEQPGGNFGVIIAETGK